MGCLKNLTRSIFLTVVIVGFASFGGREFLKTQIKNFVNPGKDVVMERAKKVGDFSKVNKEFEIEKAAGVLGYNAVLAEHKASGQKMGIIDSGKKPLLTKSDIESDKIDTKLKELADKFKYQAITVKDIEITNRGMFNVYGQDVPYAKFEAKVTKLPFSDVAGIVSSVKTNDGSEKLAISISEKKKYSQLITNEFFKGVKEHE